jgi:putative lipoic acid-binding regulatory protein
MPRKKKPLLPFPGPFSLYIMGKNEADFEVFVLELLKGHMPDLEASSLSTRLSRDGNYISVKAVLLVERKEQVDAIYRDLYEQERVLMAL